MSTADSPNTPPRPPPEDHQLGNYSKHPAAARVGGDHPARVHLPVFLWLTS